MNTKVYKNYKFWFLAPFLVSLFIATRIFSENQINQHLKIYPQHYHKNESGIIFYYVPIKDTLYYLGDDYIEVCLDSQRAYFFTREGAIDTVKISSGNKFIPRGIETPTGLYAVQNKSPIQISRLFDNTEMLNWIGFNNNIGFHGLRKTGYYASLGRRPTSHGCVRMSNEDGVRWYKKVRIGIPVLVYRKKPVWKIKFANLDEFDPNKDVLIERGNRLVYYWFNERLKKLINGNYFRNDFGKIFLAPRLRMDNSTIIVETDKEFARYQKQKLTKDLRIFENKISTYVFNDFINAKDTCKIK